MNTTIRAHELKSGMTVVLDEKERRIQRVGHDLAERMIDVRTFDGEEYVLPADGEIVLVHGSVDRPSSSGDLEEMSAESFDHILRDLRAAIERTEQ